MSNPTIDLSRGLELWYDFGADYYDNQRGEIQDKSGYGRNGVASGSPTVGVSGPAGFESTRFYRSNSSQFRTGITETETGPQTVFSIVKFNSDAESNNENLEVLGKHEGVNTVADGWRLGWLGAKGGNLDYQVHDNVPDNEVETQWGGVTDDVWYSVVGMFDGSNTHLYVDGELKDKSVVEGSVSYNDSQLYVGRSDQGLHLDGNVASVGYWTRALSVAEIMYVSKLSGPRRSIV